MVSKSEEKKIERKQKRCQHLVTNDSGIRCIDEPTPYLAVCNAGLSSGLQQEDLLDEFVKYGSVEQIFMIKGKSYCFVKCFDEQQAQQIFDTIHGKSKLAQNDGVLYLSFCQNVPNCENAWGQSLPPGLIILKDFITSDEEDSLIRCIDWSSDVDNEFNTYLKHRQVKHFGYEFLYGSNDVDVNKPLIDQRIPVECDVLWTRLAENTDLNLTWSKPEQLTVNKYEAGQGIPQHVDTHSAFHDPIISLSLLSDVVMEFRQPTANDGNPIHTKRVSVLLPRRSLLIMSNESRYGWTHKITPRKIDVYQNDVGQLKTFTRNTRISFTFRSLKHDPCECAFKLLCDTYQKQQADVDAAKTSKSEPLECPSKLELENVHKVYDEIANHFSETRHSPWPQVELFVNSFAPGCILVDIGCGNGKYLASNKDILKIGCDRSSGLLNVCRERQFNVFQCDCLAVPLQSNSVDGCISIAVIHHLASKERRLAAIKEMVRILTKSGRALIYVWAKNQEVKNKSSYLRQNKKNNRPPKPEEIETALQRTNLNDTNAFGNGLPIHTNRTQFAHQDILVPWKLKKGGNDGAEQETQCETFLRFYHVFEANELEKLCEEISEIKVIQSYYDQGNWCVIFEKIL